MQVAGTAPDTAAVTSFWWERTRCARPEVPALQAVIFSLDGVFGDARLDGELFGESVWALHCAGVQVAIVTAEHRTRIHRSVRDVLGDGAVEVMVTGDEVSRPKPDPEIYRRALAELGVAAVNALAVEDSTDGLRAARAAGLATVVVTTEFTRHHDFTGAVAVLPGYEGPESLSAHRCRRLQEHWLLGESRLSA